MSKEKTLTFMVYVVETKSGSLLFEAAFGSETHLRDSAKDLGARLAGHCEREHREGTKTSILFSTDDAILTGGHSQELWHMYRQRPLTLQERDELWSSFHGR